MPTLEIVPVVVANPYCCVAQSGRQPLLQLEFGLCVRINGDGFHLGQIDHHTILDHDRPKISCPAPRLGAVPRVQRIV